MPKQIVLTYKDVEYTLEFNRKTASAIEKQGFDYERVQQEPNTMVPLLVHGAFRMHHPTVSANLIEEIFAEIPDKTEFLIKLVEVYAEPLVALFGDSEKKEGNASWGASW